MKVINKKTGLFISLDEVAQVINDGPLTSLEFYADRYYKEVDGDMGDWVVVPSWNQIGRWILSKFLY